MIEAQAVLIDDNGAPRGEKYVIFYNPPVVNQDLGIRRSYVNETRGSRRSSSTRTSRRSSSPRAA